MSSGTSLPSSLPSEDHSHNDSDGGGGGGGSDALTKLLGTTLFVGGGDEAKPTSEALEGAELVALYFSASWCPPCRSFTPILVNFYNAAGRTNGLRIVFISSDRDVSSFWEYYSKMPWAALPMDDTESARIKQRLSTVLEVRGIPSLIVLDAKTGHYVTDGARNEVMMAASMDNNNNDDNGKMVDVVNGWKKRKPVPFEMATFGEGREPFGIISIVSFFLRNPLFVFVVMFFFNRLLERMKKLGADEGGGGGGGEF